MNVFQRSREILAAAGGRAVREAGARFMKPSRVELSRLMLWIDAVGGYLVCLGDELIIGQGIAGSGADIAIQADLSRQHAKIARIREGYVIEPIHGRVAVGGRAISEATLVSDGDEILLAASVKIRFRKPHVLSSSARLEITSGHRTQPHADAVILMAESCVLGPKWQNHVVCRDWGGDVVLYRTDGQIACRASEMIDIDGRRHNRNGTIGAGSHVVGSDFSFSIEAV
jgi:hypothetical protein